MKKIFFLMALSLACVGMTAQTSSQRFKSISEVASHQDETGRIMMQRQEAKPNLQKATTNQANANKQAISKISLSGANLRGWLAANEYTEPGFYQLDTDGKYKMLWTNEVASMGISLLNGWIKDNKLIGLGSFSSGGLIFYYNMLEFDLSTGRPINETPIGDDGLIHLNTYYLSSAYVPEEDRIYGFTYGDDDGNGYNFCWSPVDDIANVTVIKSLTDLTERTSSLCYNPEDRMFYGINYYGEFVSIDREGTENVIFDPGFETIKTDPSALVYSPLDGCFIYCAYYYDFCTQLYFIRPEKKEAEFICNFPADYQFTFLLNDDIKYDEAAPGRPEQINFSVEPGSLSGSITYKLPTESFGGSPMSDTLGWTLYVDNKSYSSGTGQPGEEVHVALENMTQGVHVIRFAASLNGKEGLSAVSSYYFGNGIPLAPRNVKVEDTRVSWDAVTQAEYGAYIDLAKLQYDIYVNGEYVGSTEKTEYSISLDASKPYSAYVVSVAAKCNGNVSSRTDSEKILFGAPLPLPYHVTPTQADADLTITINADGSPAYGEWGFSEDRWHEPVFYSGWNLVDADDWLILAPVDCSDISHPFRISLEACSGGMTSKDERFEVWCGTAPTVEAMNTLVIPETQVSHFISDGWESFSNIFLPKEAGVCYIAIRCVTPASGYSLLIRNINIETTNELADVPQSPTEMKLIDKSDADLTATISFRMPVSTIAGTTISESSDLVAVLKCGENKVEEKAAPGQVVTLTVATAQGDNRLEALCKLNGQSGQSSSLEVFTGSIVPNYVENLKAVISEDNLSINLSWEEPLGGQENLEGYYSPAGMHYWLYEQIWNDYYEVNEWLPVKDLGNVLEYKYSVNPNDRMRVRYIGIVAANNGGVSDALSYVFKVIGTPYDYIDEHFDNGYTHYGPLVIKTPAAEYQNSGWDMVAPEEVSSQMWSVDIPYAMIGYSDNEDGGKTRLSLPKVNPSACKNPALTLTLWTGDYSGKVSVYAAGYGNQDAPVKIFDVPDYNAKWETIEIPVPDEYTSDKWLELYLDCDLDSYYTYTILGNYGFGESKSSVDTAVIGDAKVYAASGRIYASGFKDGEVLNVYNVDGSLCGSAIVSGGSASLKIQSGLYIAMCGNQRAKVLVR